MASFATASAPRGVEFNVCFSSRNGCPAHPAHQDRAARATSSAGGSCSAPESTSISPSATPPPPRGGGGGGGGGGGAGSLRPSSGRERSSSHSRRHHHHHHHEPLTLRGATHVASSRDSNQVSFRHVATHSFFANHRLLARDPSTVGVCALAFPRWSVAQVAHGAMRRERTPDCCVLVPDLFARMATDGPHRCSAAAAAAAAASSSCGDGPPPSTPASPSQTRHRDLFLSVLATPDTALRHLYFGDGGNNGGGGVAAQQPTLRAPLLSFCVGSVESRIYNPETRCDDVPMLMVVPADHPPTAAPLLRLRFAADCTAHAMGLVSDAAQALALSQHRPTATGDGAAGEKGVECELFLLLGFRPGDIVVFSCASQRVVARLNSSANADACAQLWPSAVSAASVIANDTPAVGTNAQRSGDCWAETAETRAVGAEVAEQLLRAPAAPEPGLAAHAVIAAVGFDCGIVALLHIAPTVVALLRRFECFGVSRIVAIAPAPLHDAAAGFAGADSSSCSSSSSSDESGAQDCNDADGTSEQHAAQLWHLLDTAEGAHGNSSDGSAHGGDGGSVALRRYLRWIVSDTGPPLCAIANAAGSIFVVSAPSLAVLAEYTTKSGGGGGATALCWSTRWRSRLLHVACEDDSVHVVRIRCDCRSAQPSAMTGMPGHGMNPFALLPGTVADNDRDSMERNSDSEGSNAVAAVGGAVVDGARAVAIRPAVSAVFTAELVGQLLHHRSIVTGIAHLPSPLRTSDGFIVCASQDNVVSFWHAEEFEPCARCNAVAVPFRTAAGTQSSTATAAAAALQLQSPTRRRVSTDMMMSSSSTAATTATAAATLCARGGAAASVLGGLPVDAAIEACTGSAVPAPVRRASAKALHRLLHERRVDLDVGIESEVALSLLHPHSDDIVTRVAAVEGCLVTACAGGRLKVWHCVPPIITESLEDVLR